MALRRWLVVLLVVAGIGCAGIARADHQPAIVVPGKRGVPVIINGRDATGAIVIGDWGLYRPGHMAPTVIYRQPWIRYPDYRHPRPARRHYRYKRVHPRRHKWVRPIRRKAVVRSRPRHFFPGGTSPPMLGRHESDEPSSPSPPAEDFSRSWSARSSPAPATIGQPPVVVAPVVVDPGRRPLPPKPGL